MCRTRGQDTGDRIQVTGDRGQRTEGANLCVPQTDNNVANPVETCHGASLQTNETATTSAETQDRASLQLQDGFVLALPYDPSLLPQGFTEEDIQTYYYDRHYQRWVAIERDSMGNEHTN